MLEWKKGQIEQQDIGKRMRLVKNAVKQERLIRPTFYGRRFGYREMVFERVFIKIG